MTPEVLKSLAEEAYSENRMCCVIELLEAYLHRNSNDGRAWYLLADAQRTLNMFGEATISFRNAIETCPSDYRWTAEARMGLLFADKGDHTTADRWYRAALNAPNARSCSWVWVDRGRSFVKQGLFSEAEDCFRKAITVNPEDEVAQLSLAIVYNARKEYSRSEPIISGVLQSNPLSEEAMEMWNDLAAIEEAQKAIHLFEVK